MTSIDPHNLQVLANLTDNIAARAEQSPDISYTAKLLSQGPEKCAKKFGEEAVELALASMTDKPDQVTAEAADVMYHFLVLLQATGVSLSDVMTTLDKRTGQSGLQEKANRKENQ